MRIPPSVIVMSVLSAVPFGLGIRDTLARKDGMLTVDSDGLLSSEERRQREDEAALASFEEEERRKLAEIEARSAKNLAQLDQLYGAKVASMGTLLDGIVLGASAGSFQPEDVRMRLERVARESFIHVDFEADATALNAVSVTFGEYDNDSCGKLATRLAAAWGPGTRNVWLDPSTHQRAIIERVGCELRFDRYLEPTEWVGKLPIQLIGGKLDKLTAELPGVVDEEIEEGVWWHMPGLRYGSGDTKLEAYVEAGKVVAMRVHVDSDFDSQLAVRDALTAKLKVQPKKDEDAGAWVWKARVPVTLEEIDTERFSLTVGKI